jgi:hypothetical protein
MRSQSFDRGSTGGAQPREVERQLARNCLWRPSASGQATRNIRAARSLESQTPHLPKACRSPTNRCGQPRQPCFADETAFPEVEDALRERAIVKSYMLARNPRTSKTCNPFLNLPRRPARRTSSNATDCFNQEDIRLVVRVTWFT